MTREEFVTWFDSNVGFEKESRDSDYAWRNMVNYEPLRYVYVRIDENKVVYSWEELYWGGSDWREREFTFDEFVEAYKNDCLEY